jgi:hypothetical protein
MDEPRFFRAESVFSIIFAHLSYIFADVAYHQQPPLWSYFSGLQCNEPFVLTHVAFIFTNVACVWSLPDVSVLLSHIAKLLARVALLLAHVTELQPNLSCAYRPGWCDVARL